MVSIIIPAYNVEKFLPRCIGSLQGQTVADWEAIFVNDGSVDRTSEILHGYAADDPRIIVIDKPNSGPSDSRNAALDVARGEYIVFVDADDFIHPQTLEIGLSVLRRSKADMASWYKDTSYRTDIIFRHLLHLDTIGFRPVAFKKRYDADSVGYEYTEDIFSVATELTRQNQISKPIKHCYVWCHMFRREILQGVRFESGLLFEDFPWWCAVMLQNPKVAYTGLPLYFYNFNIGSIDVASVRGKKVAAWVKGMEITCDAYLRKANAHQMERWSRNFKWPVLNKHIARFLPSLSPDNPCHAQIHAGLKRLRDAGAFADAMTDKDFKARRAIEAFVTQ